MKTTFINQNTDNTHHTATEKALESTADDFTTFMNSDSLEGDNDGIGSFYDYGLSFDYVALDTFEDMENDYFRYQLSWGGPSDELRFYEDGTIEYVYMDWFCGAGVDVTYEDWAQWVKNSFLDCCMMDFEAKREENNYYEILAEREGV